MFAYLISGYCTVVQQHENNFKIKERFIYTCIDVHIHAPMVNIHIWHLLFKWPLFYSRLWVTSVCFQRWNFLSFLNASVCCFFKNVARSSAEISKGFWVTSCSIVPLLAHGCILIHVLLCTKKAKGLDDDFKNGSLTNRIYVKYKILSEGWCSKRCTSIALMVWFMRMKDRSDFTHF